MLDLTVYHIFTVVVLGLGIYNVMISKNLVKSVLIVEMMLGSVNLILFQASLRNGNDTLGKTALITSIVIGAGLSAFLLSMCVKVYREFGTLNPEKLRTLRG